MLKVSSIFASINNIIKKILNTHILRYTGLMPQSYPNDFKNLIKKAKRKFGKDILDIEGIGFQTDFPAMSKEFFKTNNLVDVSIDANANVSDHSVVSYTVETLKPIFKLNSLYMLWDGLKELYGKEEADRIVMLQLGGDIYINDFTGFGGGLPYCYNYSTYDVMVQGLPMVDRIISIPPKHLYSFKSQLEQFIGIAANSTLGATGIADLLIVMSYYVKNILNTRMDAHFTLGSEENCWKYIRENLVSFIYTINQPYRSAIQSPFCNVSLYDRYFLMELRKTYLFPDGSYPDIDIVMKLQELYCNIMNEEMDRTPITFPVTTACISVKNNEIQDTRFVQSKEFLEFVSKHILKYGFMKIYAGETSTISSCCRLRSNMIKEYINSLGGGSTKLGSIGVVGINMARLGRLAYHDNYKFNKNLIDLIQVTGKINHVKREIIKRRIKDGFHPLYTYGFCELEKQYSTTGITGFYECLQYLGYDITTDAGIDKAIEICNVFNNQIELMENLYNTPHNLEQTPSESAAVKMAQKDRHFNLNDDYDFYSNQFIPLSANIDLLTRIKIQGILDKYFTGGSALHINLNERIDSVEDMMNLIEYCIERGVIYFGVNYLLCQCKEGHMFVGNQDSNKCPICNSAVVNIYTTVVGFLSNIKNWNKTRREKDVTTRKFY